MKRVCLVSSGTGGHLMPAVALARALQGAGHAPTLLTEGRTVERDLLDRCMGPEDDDRLATAQLHIDGSSLGLPLRFANAAMQARRFFRENQVDLVVGAGGRTTIPAALAARSLRLPVCLLEQNVVTGRANRMLLPLAERIDLGLPPRRPLRNSLVTGTPLRRDLGTVDRADARRNLGLCPDRPVVMVTGGSQGARALNEIVPHALGLVPGEGPSSLQVLHLAGSGRDREVRARYDAYDHISALVRPAAMDMATLYAAADLVICRGGGGTVAELMVAGRPSIIVPYPHHRDRQQWYNGRVLETSGAAHVRAEKDLDPGELAGLVGGLLRDPARLAEMGERARKIAPADPCRQILHDLRRLGVLD